jgi:hypothetical protein
MQIAVTPVTDHRRRSQSVYLRSPAKYARAPTRRRVRDRDDVIDGRSAIAAQATATAAQSDAQALGD